MPTGIRIQQQLVGIEAMTRIGIVGAMDTIAVNRARSDAGQITVPDLVGMLGQLNAGEFLLALRVQCAEPDR